MDSEGRRGIRRIATQTSMLSRITSVLKSGGFWAGFFAGAIAAIAFPKLGNLVKPVASKLPGSQA